MYTFSRAKHSFFQKCKYIFYITHYQDRHKNLASLDQRDTAVTRLPSCQAGPALNSLSKTRLLLLAYYCLYHVVCAYYTKYYERSYDQFLVACFSFRSFILCQLKTYYVIHAIPNIIVCYRRLINLHLPLQPSRIMATPQENPKLFTKATLSRDLCGVFLMKATIKKQTTINIKLKLNTKTFKMRIRRTPMVPFQNIFKYSCG